MFMHVVICSAVMYGALYGVLYACVYVGVCFDACMCDVCACMYASLSFLVCVGAITGCLPCQQRQWTLCGRDAIHAVMPEGCVLLRACEHLSDCLHPTVDLDVEEIRKMESVEELRQLCIEKTRELEEMQHQMHELASWVDICTFLGGHGSLAPLHDLTLSLLFVQRLDPSSLVR